MNDLMQRVFSVPQEMARLLDLAYEERQESGEVSPELIGELEREAISFDKLVTDICNWYLYAEAKHKAEEAGLKPLIQEMRDKLKGHEEKLEFIEHIARRVLPPSKQVDFVNDSVRIYYRESQELICKDDESATPLEFCELKPVPDKKLIKAAIEKWQLECAAAKAEGRELPAHPCPGWEIQTNWNPQIGLGGPSAQKNARARLKKMGIESTTISRPLIEK